MGAKSSKLIGYEKVMNKAQRLKSQKTWSRLERLPLVLIYEVADYFPAIIWSLESTSLILCSRLSKNVWYIQTMLESPIFG